MISTISFVQAKLQHSCNENKGGCIPADFIIVVTRVVATTDATAL